MKKLISSISIFTLLVSVSASGFAGPCAPIEKACIKNGFYKGGAAEHKGLMKNCVIPVAMGNKMLPNVTFSEKQLETCKVKIAQKMKNKM